MAPEAVHHRLYTSQSDIWSYGILLWEIMTMGESPFKDVHFEQFMENLRTGAHPSQPHYCPNNVYIVMQACWRFRPEDRPTWDKVVDSMYHLCLGKLVCTEQLLLDVLCIALNLSEIKSQLISE
jgi:serine/threonine protein kinase